MLSIDITRRLELNGFNKRQIDDFKVYYSEAINAKIPFPYYYALLRTLY